MATLDSQSYGLIITLVIGTAILLVSLFVFDILRRRIPSIFEARRALNTARLQLDYSENRVHSPPPPSHRLFGWLAPLLRIELENIAVTHGLDTALFLRYLRSMTALFLILCLPTIVLLAVFQTASNKNLPLGHPNRVIGVQMFSISNIERNDSWRFWLVLAMEYIILILVCFVLYKEFQVYSKHRRAYRSSNNPANFAIVVQDIPSSSCSEQAIYEYWDNIFPDQIRRVYFVRNGRKLLAKHKKFWNAVQKRERAEWDLNFNPKLAGKRPTHKLGPCSCCRGSSVAVDSINHWTEQQNHYANKIAFYQQDANIKLSSPTASAIVVFTTRRGAADAAQINISRVSYEWQVSRAPEPNAVNWSSLGIPGWQTGFRVAITIILSALLIIFWIIPVSIIMSLVNLDSLARIKINGGKPFMFLESVLGWSPFVKGIIESFLPSVILSGFLALIPTFFRWFISISRVSSLAKVDMLVRDWYFVFVLFSNFVFVIVAGSLLGKIFAIIQDPGQLADFLASSAPKQGSFMMNFILLKALSETPLEILQLPRVGMRWIFLKFFARTTREKNNVSTGSTHFLFFRYYGMAQLVGLLGIIYCTIAPFIIPICVLYYGVMYTVWKYNLCFSLHNEYESGGRMYGGALFSLWLSLFLHLVTMIGLFGLNKTPAQTVLVVIPAVVSVIFLIYCRKRFTRVCEHGSVYETQLIVEEQEQAHEISDGLASKYIHPAFTPLPDPIEDLSGVHDEKVDVTPELCDDLENNIAADLGDAKIEQQPAANSVSSGEWKDASGAPASRKEEVGPP